MTTGNDKLHSSIISHRLPEFVQTDNPTLVAFVQAYYEWLEGQKEKGYLRTPIALDNLTDIDQQLDVFVKDFKEQYLLGFPEELAVNDSGNTINVRQLIKNIKEFYRNKGTEKTYEFLFRVLYDAAVEFYYPSRDILRLSDGKWIQKKSIKCSNELGKRIFEARGKIVKQRSVDGAVIASAKVLDVVVYQLGSREIAELYLTNINGQFRSNTDAINNYMGIEFDGNDGSILMEKRVYPVLTSVSVTSAGDGYRKGERVFFQPDINPFQQNLLKYSQQFDVPSYWVLGGQPGSGDTPTAEYAKARSISVTNKTTAPDGSYTAYRFVPSDFSSGGAGNNFFTITASARNIKYENGKYYTISCYLKADDYLSAYLRLTDSGRSSFTQILVNPNTSEITSNDLANSTNKTGWLQHDKKVVSAGNGWYRVSFTAQRNGATINNGTVDVFLGRGAYNNSLLQTATTNYGIFVWGLQVNEADDSTEAAEHPSPYLKTVATAPIEIQEDNDTGQGAVATITEVNSVGGIAKIRIDNFGVGYQISPNYTIDTAFGASGALSTTVGTVCQYPGYYSGNDGRLSTNKVMQDNHYYQNFSYVLLSEVVIDRYKEILRRLIHPTGMGMFGKVVINRCTSDPTYTDSLIKKTDNEIIGNYSPYTLHTNVDIGTLLFNGRPTPYFPDLHDAQITGSSGNPTDLQLYSTGQNYLTWSNSATKWGLSTSHWEVTDNAAIAPDGSNTASLIKKKIDATNTTSRSVKWSSNSTSSTFSVYLKRPTTNGKRYASLVFRNDSNTLNLLSAVWDFDEMQFFGGSSTVTSSYGTASYELASDDWVRIILSVSSGITKDNNLRLYFADSGVVSGERSWITNESIFVWGIQLEEGTSADSLIKTTVNPIVHRSYAIAFDPKGLTGLKVWLDGKTLTGAAGATVGAWADSSGNGYTASAYAEVLYPTVSEMGGLYLTGSVLTFGSILTTPNFSINQRTMFAAFTPFLPSGVSGTSQRNSLVVGLLRGQSKSSLTGAATGQHYQTHSICVNYDTPAADDSSSNLSPQLLAYYGFGNHAGPNTLYLTNINGNDVISSIQEISAGRFSTVYNDSAKIAWTFPDDLSNMTSGNQNTVVACSVLAADSISLTATMGFTGTEVIKPDYRSNSDLTPGSRDFRWQQMAEYTITANGSYQFSMDMKIGGGTWDWRAVLTKNDGLVQPTPTNSNSVGSLPEIPSYLASWTHHTMSEISSGWNSSTYQTHKVIIKDLKEGDVIRVWMTPSYNSGSAPTNPASISAVLPNSLYLKNFTINRIFTSNKNFLTVNGDEVGSAVGLLDGITASQRLTLGFGQNYFNGVIHEVLVYDRLLSKQERQTVEAYLYHRWKNDIIRSETHAWNLPIASLTAGIYPALPSEGGYTATANFTTVLGYPFHEISSHPNVFLSEKDQPYAARILHSQKDDFLGNGDGSVGYWKEWVLGGTLSQNLLTYSNSPSQWGIPYFYKVTQNIASYIAPDNSNSVSLLERTQDVQGILRREVKWNSTESNMTYSVYVKKPDENGIRYGSFAVRNTTTSTNLVLVVYDFDNDEFVDRTTGTGIGTTVVFSDGYATRETARNGWTRIIITITNGVTSGDILWLYYGNSGEAVDNFAYWPISKGMLIWGIQFEEGTSANPPTVSFDAPVNNSAQNRRNWATGLSAAGANGSRIAMLSYDLSSEFRKITAEAFFDRELGRQFDCKNEIIVVPAAPKVKLQVCDSFNSSVDEVVYTNGNIIFNYSIENETNMEYWIADRLEVEISDGRKFFRYRPEATFWNGKFFVSGFGSVGSEPKFYTATFRLKNYYGKVIPESEVTVSFNHKFVEVPFSFDTISSCS